MPQKRTHKHSTLKTPVTRATPTRRKGKQARSTHSGAKHEASSFSRIRTTGGSAGGGLGKHGRAAAPNWRDTLGDTLSDAVTWASSGGTRKSMNSSAGTSGAAGMRISGGPGDGVSSGATSFEPEVILTRRNLLLGAGAIGGLAAVSGISGAVTSAIQNSMAVQTLSVPKENVTDLASFNEVPFGDYLKASTTTRLPFGTLVWANNDNIAACLCPTNQAHPLNTIRLFYFDSANLVEVLKQAQGHDDGFDVFDVRCSSEGAIWLECNIYEDSWRVYTARINNAQLVDIKKVDEGDVNWDAPSIAICGNTAFWQVNPNTEGEHAKENAEVRALKLGEEQYKVVCDALRTFACRIVATEDGVVVAPRLNTSTRYFQLTKIKAEDFSITDKLTLPHDMTPCNIGYGKSGFAFSFDKIYNYGDGISNLGTYTTMGALDAYHYDNRPWFHFNRTPSATPVWVNEWFVVKSARAICGVHFASKNYFMIQIPNDTDTYGEYLVSSGACKIIVGLSQINTSTEGETDHALLRVFVPTNSPGNAFS